MFFSSTKGNDFRKLYFLFSKIRICANQDKQFALPETISKLKKAPKGAFVVGCFRFLKPNPNAHANFRKQAAVVYKVGSGTLFIIK
jgi:hypothetical protein